MWILGSITSTLKGKTNHGHVRQGHGQLGQHLRQLPVDGLPHPADRLAQQLAGERQHRLRRRPADRGHRDVLHREGDEAGDQGAAVQDRGPGEPGHQCLQPGLPLLPAPAPEGAARRALAGHHRARGTAGRTLRVDQGRRQADLLHPVHVRGDPPTQRVSAAGHSQGFRPDGDGPAGERQEPERHQRQGLQHGDHRRFDALVIGRHGGLHLSTSVEGRSPPPVLVSFFCPALYISKKIHTILC